MDAKDAIAQAAAKNDFAAIVRLATGAGKLRDLSTVTNIGEGTLRGIGAGRITPSKNQGVKLRGAVPALIS
ncbi:MAG: hypothetical protein EBQ96_09885 [Proteobacteria bacterium]|nr:hypothetical protein [Pseudomonadota bacterium]